MEEQLHGEKYEQLRREISEVINKFSLENDSNTADFVLADFMLGCMNVYVNTIDERERLAGRPRPLKEKDKVKEIPHDQN